MVVSVCTPVTYMSIGLRMWVCVQWFCMDKTGYRVHKPGNCPLALTLFCTDGLCAAAHDAAGELPPRRLKYVFEVTVTLVETRFDRPGYWPGIRFGFLLRCDPIRSLTFHPKSVPFLLHTFRQLANICPVHFQQANRTAAYFAVRGNVLAGSCLKLMTLEGIRRLWAKFLLLWSRSFERCV